MAKVLSLDFKRGEYFIGATEVGLTDCLEQLAEWQPFNPAEVIAGAGWKIDLADLGEGNYQRDAFLTADALAALTPYLLDGGVTARMVFSVNAEDNSHSQANVGLRFTDADATAGWFAQGAHEDGSTVVDPDFYSQFGNYSDGFAATQYALSEGRHCIAVSFTTEEIDLSLNGAAAVACGQAPEVFSFDQAWLHLAIAGFDAGGVATAAAILEKIEFFADTGNGIGVSEPTLPTLSTLPGDGEGDGLTDDDLNVRSWGFSLDGHDYAVFRLGPTESLIFDLTTNSWSSWSSPGLAYWRAHIGQNWAGMTAALDDGSDIVAGDDASGVLWILDPAYGRDDRTTSSSDSFPRVVTGGIAVSGRKTIPCGAVTLDCSVGAPSQTGAEVSLAISDDLGQNWTDCGARTVAAGEYSAVLEWRGLGTIKAPGRVFRFTDNGATVRFNAANLR